MRDLLFLAHRVPYPPDKGDKIRAWHMFLHLARRFRVHLGCFVDDPDDAARVSELRPLCADLMCIPINRRTQRLKALARARPGLPLTFSYFDDPRMQRWVDAALARHAIRDIFVYSSAMAHYVMRPNLLATKAHADRAEPGNEQRPPIRVLDMVDVDSAKWTAYAMTARWPARAVFAREGRTLLAFERHAARAFDHSIFVSEAEWRHFLELAPEAWPYTGWIENGVDLDYFSPDLSFPDPFPELPAPPLPTNGSSAPFPAPLADPAPFPATAPPTAWAPRLVFTGRMDYRPNIEAVSWFAGAVMPALRARMRDARFAIVGAAPAREVSRLADLPGVIVTGRVADTRPWLAHATIVVAPMLIGRGTQNKVLEGMAMAKPVIATPEAFEGVQARPEQDILLASGVEQTIAKIIEVLSGQHPGLGAAARQAMRLRHDWSVTLAGLDRLFPDVAFADAAPPCPDAKPVLRGDMVPSEAPVHPGKPVPGAELVPDARLVQPSGEPPFGRTDPSRPETA